MAGLLQPRLMVIDCAALGFCDSSGISSLIAIHQWLSARGSTLRLAAVPHSGADLQTDGPGPARWCVPHGFRGPRRRRRGAAASSPADTSASTHAAVQG
ncbi:anti-sigma factor antagonist [Streptomyces sp. T1317-0309]|nr:anti-sigma factor antagonist [Streptomyces sp. T1317-0309]